MVMRVVVVMRWSGSGSGNEWSGSGDESGSGNESGSGSGNESGSVVVMRVVVW